MQRQRGKIGQHCMYDVCEAYKKQWFNFIFHSLHHDRCLKLNISNLAAEKTSKKKFKIKKVYFEVYLI